MDLEKHFENGLIVADYTKLLSQDQGKLHALYEQTEHLQDRDQLHPDHTASVTTVLYGQAPSSICAGDMDVDRFNTPRYNES